MKKIYLAFTFIILTCLTTQGQNYLKEFGRVSKDEIKLKEYSPDKDAEALVLFDIAKSYFVRNEASFNIVFERTTRIKILSEAGIEWAEVEIPFYQEGGIFEEVYGIKAYTYNYENGQIIKSQFDVSNTYDEKINNYWNVKKFAIPNVKEGSIIEYKYKISSQYKFNLRDWAFQWKIPVVYSEYEVKMIPFYEYTFLLQGANKFDSQTSYLDRGNLRQFGSITFNDMVYKYIMKDLPAFNNEEFITSINDYIITLDFQLSKINYPSGTTLDIITTWEDMIKELLKHKDFGKYVNKSKKLASKLINTETLDLGSDKEKFDYVLDYVKSNYNWNNSKAKYATKSPNKFIEEKYGNCAEINLFTIGLLNSLGIEAYPVLISTRDNGKIKYDYPYSHFFNYVIILAKVDGEKILSDATEVLCLNNRIPPRCINDKGLVIKKDNVEWAGLECHFPSEINTDVQIEIVNDELVNSSITKTSTEYDALFFRNNYTDKIETVKNKLDTKYPLLIDSTISIQNQLNKEEPYILSYKLTDKPEIVGEKMYLSPFLNEPIADNPLKQKKRTYPIDMTYQKKRSFHSTILIPEDYQVDFLPPEKKINNKLFELTYSAKKDNDKIIVSFDYYFKKSVYSPIDYSKMKFYYNEIVNKGNEKIVLSKKM